MKIHSGKWQLNAIGIFLLGILGIIASWLCRTPLNLDTAIPLACIIYVASSIIFELTINRANVPTLATSLMAQRKIVELLTEDAANQKTENYAIVDLGSGRGELARRIAKKIPKAHIYAIEKARLPHWQAAGIGKLLGTSNITYMNSDFWSYDCSESNAVFLYLTARLAKEVGEKLDKELKPGSLVISSHFALQGAWGEPASIIELRTPFKETLFVYRKKHGQA